jgi:hypothetical protein
MTFSHFGPHNLAPMDSHPPHFDESGEEADVDLAIRTSSASASAMHTTFTPRLTSQLRRALSAVN